MRKIHTFRKIAVITVIFLLGTLSPMKAAEIKIGYVDTAVIMQKAPQAESAVRKIESEFAPRDNELAEKQKKIAKLEDDLVRDGDVMSNKERRNLIQEVRSLKREQRRLQEEFREEFTMRRNELQNEITLVVIKAIKTIAKMENYDLIIDTAIHAGKRVDITSKVISQLKTDFKEQK